jgi:long-chain acyl-CoA synthetase
MIITGGENVYPKEVEEVLFTREEVQECAGIGLPDKEWGERVVAFIIQRPGKHSNKEALHAYLKSRLSSFKVPKEYRLVNDFPKSPAGKILKRELKKWSSLENETSISRQESNAIDKKEKGNISVAFFIVPN